MMILKNKKVKAFTLVELIVVITIIAILWTIGFISLQWFAKSARDSSRISDFKNIEKVLSLYHLRVWNLPVPTLWEEITYSWAEVWTQWTFWEDTRRLLWSKGQISTIPTDPLTWNEYTYSITNTKQEFQLWVALEWWGFAMNDWNIINSTYAWDSLWYSYIRGTYNEIMTKVSTWSVDYVLAVPTIISWDIYLTDVVSLMNENKLAYNWSSNLPHSYSWTIYNMRWEDINYSLVQPLKVLLFSGSLDDLMADIDKQVQLLENVQDVYSWTNVIWENDIITNITNLTINTVTPSENDKFVASTTIKYALNLDWIKIVWTPDPVITWPAILNITFIQADNQTYICTACD